MNASRVVQVVPGQRVRVSGKWVVAGTALLLLTLGVAALQGGDAEEQQQFSATVKARPSPVQEYEPSATDTAVRNVANRIWESDHYRGNMTRSFFLWIVCIPVLVVAVYLSRACCYPDEQRSLAGKGSYAPMAQATYGAESTTVVPAKIVPDDRDSEDDLPAACAVSSEDPPGGDFR